VFYDGMQHAAIAVTIAAVASAYMHFHMFETSRVQRSFLCAVAAWPFVVLYQFVILEPTPFLMGPTIVTVAVAPLAGWIVSAALGSKRPR
jgi:hypothetical protein